MSLRHLSTYRVPVNSAGSLCTSVSASVYRDSEWQEYRVKFYKAGPDGVGIHQRDGDYHCDTHEEAIQNAVHIAEQLAAAV